MVIESGWIAIGITILVALLTLAVAWGSLHEKVKGQQHQIDSTKSEIKSDREENRSDHQEIMRKMDCITDGINEYLGKK